MGTTSEDKFVFVLVLKHRRGQLPALPRQEPQILNSTGGVPGVAARGRSNLGYQPDRVTRGKRGHTTVPYWLSRERGAPKASPQSLPARLTLDLPSPGELSSLYPFHIIPLLCDPHISVRCDSAKARNWPCWGPEV